MNKIYKIKFKKESGNIFIEDIALVTEKNAIRALDFFKFNCDKNNMVVHITDIEVIQ